jgi:hypothetical protein
MSAMIDVYRAATKGEKNRTGAVRFVNEKDKDEKELLPPPAGAGPRRAQQKRKKKLPLNSRVTELGYRS